MQTRLCDTTALGYAALEQARTARLRLMNPHASPVRFLACYPWGPVLA